MPEYIWIPALLVLLALIVALFLQRMLRVPAVVMPQSLRTVLVPAAEQQLICQLEKILGSRCRVFWRVSLEDLLQGQDSQANYQASLAARRFTCVVCRRDNFAILALVDYRGAGQSRPADQPALPSSLPLLTVSEENLHGGDFEKLLTAHFPELIQDLCASAVAQQSPTLFTAPHF